MTDIETVERFRPELDAKLQQDAMAQASADLRRQQEEQMWRLRERELAEGAHR